MARKNPELTGQTIRNIKEAFWKLYEEKPIEKISVKQITDLAGYNRATFYLYFSSVRDVRDQIEDDLITQRDAMLSASMRDGQLAITPELMDVPMTLFRYGRVLLGPHGDPKFVERAENSVWPYIQPILFPDTPNVEDIKDPQERRRLELLKHFYLSGILGIFRAALNDRDLIDPTEIGRFMSEELLPRIAPHTADAGENQAAKPNDHAEGTRA
ncbi:TetR/AcrR family transcriptional regulator [Bifidobacterium rousetti]|uniref:TetR/AcrR family transcriptional regulator n=1 Tax=Bifidobacterium rousetti TaxID=2045439 RepID=UPI001CC3262B|nr:TetR/AcrR family transcriptional regulator [Bifidobacterium rousetti]